MFRVKKKLNCEDLEIVLYDIIAVCTTIPSRGVCSRRRAFWISHIGSLSDPIVERRPVYVALRCRTYIWQFVTFFKSLVHTVQERIYKRVPGTRYLARESQGTLAPTPSTSECRDNIRLDTCCHTGGRDTRFVRGPGKTCAKRRAIYAPVGTS